MSHSKKADILFLSMILIHIGVYILLLLLGTRVNISTNQSLLFSQLLILTPVGFYLLLTNTNPIKLIRFKKLDISTIFMVILLTFLMMPLISFLNALSMLFSENAVLSLTDEMSGNSLLLNLIMMAVIPAVSEEFVFRGVLFHTYRKSSVLYGAVISGVVFGLMHLNFNQFSYAFILGIIFALLIEATGSIYATMLAHFIINGNSVVVMKISGSQQALMQSQLTPETLRIAVVFYGAIAVITTTLAIGVYIWIVNHCNRVNHMRAVFLIRKGEDKFDLKKAISICLIASIIISVGFMFYNEKMSAAVNQRSIEQNIEDVGSNTL